MVRLIVHSCACANWYLTQFSRQLVRDWLDLDAGDCFESVGTWDEAVCLYEAAKKEGRLTLSLRSVDDYKVLGPTRRAVQ
jgi:hypothetical protein